ncbi:LON peptidase substrate-binding domain-containing protein [Sphingomonas quercus]|uniref:LON peptidase substrate-binding domain-containing protein n=1 Tax=Sphingomonas quercus TaxID=2842451 RepID=A0ABS6BFI7_9SPHN|nr:LON peptidase substrate-binding domain-containing protein [Sphingomonas quercus]MBU3076954.1 LON peptidase substrate-binding domain-containing protein [Sphingomonas quercus]
MAAGARLSIFPLAGAILFPRGTLPLHIFEPRYRAMISDALIRDRRIGMVQPRDDHLVPALYDIGCVGRIVHVEAMEDGRYNIVLEGLSRFRILRELDTATAFRQVEAELAVFCEDEPAPLPFAVRAEVEREARRFADARGYAVDWDEVGRIDDESLINGVAQIAPFDVVTRQALLEAPGLPERAELLVQFLQFYRLSGAGAPPLQ